MTRWTPRYSRFAAIPHPSKHILRTDLTTTFVVFGSYFPAWIACLLLGMVASVVIHLVLQATDMVAAVPLLPVFHLLVILLGATGSWLILFAAG